jgi:hypothetical protein
MNKDESIPKEQKVPSPLDCRADLFLIMPEDVQHAQVGLEHLHVLLQQTCHGMEKDMWGQLVWYLLLLFSKFKAEGACCRGVGCGR